MFTQVEEKIIKFFAPIFLMMTIIGFVIMGAENLLGNEDYYFLYNRARQLLSCIQDGAPIGFFYNDLNGVGYGSSFFYGYLTLIPFLPLLNISSTIFINSYLVVAGLVFCFGVLYLVSRFTDKYVFITCLFLLSTFVIEMFSATGLIVNYFAVGLSFFFIGTCIDFFRDDKKFIWSSILFFLILNTHTITAFLSFLICVFMFISYFDKKRIKDYCLFAFVTLLFCSYFIFTFITHIDLSMSLNKTTKEFIDVIAANDKQHNMFCGSSFAFCDVLTMNCLHISSINGYSFFGLGFLLVSIVVLLQSYKLLSKKEVLCLFGFVIGLILGINDIWVAIINRFNVPIQFPLRYMFYLLLGFYIIVCRRIENKGIFIVLFLISIPNIMFRFHVGNVDLKMNTLAELYNHQMVNAEYLSDDFDFDLDTFERHRNEVVDEDGTQYVFVKDKDVLYVKFNTDEEHTLTIPKLYYNGYVCENTETHNQLQVNKGISQFISVTIPSNSRGIYAIYFDDTNLSRLQLVNYIFVVIVSGLFLFVDYQNFHIKFARKS